MRLGMNCKPSRKWKNSQYSPAFTKTKLFVYFDKLFSVGISKIHPWKVRTQFWNKIFLKGNRKIIRTYEFRDLKIRGRLRGRDLAWRFSRGSSIVLFFTRKVSTVILFKKIKSSRSQNAKTSNTAVFDDLLICHYNIFAKTHSSGENDDGSSTSSTQ